MTQQGRVSFLCNKLILQISVTAQPQPPIVIKETLWWAVLDMQVSEVTTPGGKSDFSQYHVPTRFLVLYPSPLLVIY